MHCQPREEVCTEAETEFSQLKEEREQGWGRFWQEFLFKKKKKLQAAPLACLQFMQFGVLFMVNGLVEF